jgi:hypothetical protein
VQIDTCIQFGPLGWFVVDVALVDATGARSNEITIRLEKQDYPGID